MKNNSDELNLTKKVSKHNRWDEAYHLARIIRRESNLKKGKKFKLPHSNKLRSFGAEGKRLSKLIDRGHIQIIMLRIALGEDIKLKECDGMSKKEIRREILKIKKRKYGCIPTSGILKSDHRQLYMQVNKTFGDYRTFKNWMDDPIGYKQSWSYTDDASLIWYVENYIKPQYGINMPTQETLSKDGHSTFSSKASLYKNDFGMRGLINDCNMLTSHLIPVKRTKENIIKEARAISNGSPKTLPDGQYLRKNHGALLASIHHHFSNLSDFANTAGLAYYPKQTKWTEEMIIDSLKSLAGDRNEWPGRWRVESVRGLYRSILRRGGPHYWCQKMGWTYGHLAADGEYYDSNAEVLVANLLLNNNIEYIWGVSTNQTKPYITDFFLPKSNLFIEVIMCDCEQPQDTKIRKSYCERWNKKKTHYEKNELHLLIIKPEELETVDDINKLLTKIQDDSDRIVKPITSALRKSSAYGHGYWKNWSVIKKILIEITQQVGCMPRRIDFFSDKNNQIHQKYQLKNVYNAIHKNFNGLDVVAEKLNLPPSPDVPHNPSYWKNIDNVMLELVIVFFQNNKFPSTYQLKELGQLSLLNSILRFGGIKNVQQQFMKNIQELK